MADCISNMTGHPQHYPAEISLSGSRIVGQVTKVTPDLNQTTPETVHSVSD